MVKTAFGEQAMVRSQTYQ